jgi:hypothetical protein
LPSHFLTWDGKCRPKLIGSDAYESRRELILATIKSPMTGEQWPIDEVHLASQTPTASLTN